MALSVEAAELLEHFLWIEGDASRRIVNDPAKMGEIADETADVMVCLLCLANGLGIDISEAVEKKMAKNAVKYPVEKVRGRWRVEE
jgi:NTP pyrophosphatase (non-canonical NTP hydrolase)